MSDNNPSDSTNGTSAPPAETEAAKRERRNFPIRLLYSQDEGLTWRLLKDPQLNTIEQAEKWIADNGVPGTAYMMARVIGAKRRPPTKLEDVVLS